AASKNKNTDGEEAQDTRENGESNTSKNMSTPGVTIPKLIETIESPSSIKHQHLRYQLAQQISPEKNPTQQPTSLTMVVAKKPQYLLRNPVNDFGKLPNNDQASRITLNNRIQTAI